MQTARSQIVRILASCPPPEVAKGLIDELPRGEAFAALLEAHRDASLAAHQLTMLSALIGPFVAGAVDAAVLALLGDSGVPARNRAALLSALLEHADSPEAIAGLVSQLGVKTIEVLTREAVVDLLGEAQAGGTAHAQALASQPDEVALDTVREWNKLRTEISLPAHVLFSSVLEHESIWGRRAILDRVLDAVATEADGEGIALLQRARRSCPKHARAAVQAALTKAMSLGASVAGQSSDPSLEAWASFVDGKGAVGMFLCRPNADGTLLIAHLVVRLADGVRFGSVFARATRSEFDDMRREMMTGFARAPAGELAHLVRRCAERDERGETFPDQPLDEPGRRALKAFLAVRGVAPALEAAPAVDDAKAAMLIGEKDCENWFFDAEDLELARISPELRRATDRPSIESSLRALAAVGMRERVVAMCQYQSCRLRWRGRAFAAKLWGNLALEVEARFERSRVARWMCGDPEVKRLRPTMPRAGRTELALWADEFADRQGEQWRITATDADGRSKTYTVLEALCADPSCECEKVSLRARAPGEGLEMGLAYFFDPASDFIRSRTEQIEVEPNVPVTATGQRLVGQITRRLKEDPSWTELLRTHYLEFKAKQRGEPYTAAPANTSAAQPTAPDGYRAFAPVGRNDACPCGSGKKYKKCHGANA